MSNPRYGDWRPGADYHVFPLDSSTSAVFVSGTHHVLLVPPETAERLSIAPTELIAQETAEWNRLATDGVLSEAHRDTSRRSGPLDGANLAINLNLTAVCNLDCSYCFAEGGDYGRITGHLSAESIPPIFAFVREHVTGSRTVRFEFFGGEPLINTGRIVEVCDEAQRLREETGIRFVFRVSTNLTVLPVEAIRLFAANDFIVSVSIDGGRETQNRNRPNKAGEGSFDRVLRNARRVRELGDHITLVARMTVVGDRPRLVDNVRELWELNLFDWFQIYPGVVPREKGDVLAVGEDGTLPILGQRSAVATQTMSSTFLPQLRELLEHYPAFFSEGNRFRGVLEYESYAEMILEGRVATAYCSGGRNYFTFSPDDSIMPCHRVVGSPELQAGRLDDGLQQDLSSWRHPVDSTEVCSDCAIRYVCGGGCKQENLIATGQLNTPNPENCAYQFGMLEGIVRVLTDSGSAYRRRDRTPLRDLFVSCGRPTVRSGRRTPTLQGPTQFFQVL